MTAPQKATEQPLLKPAHENPWYVLATLDDDPKENRRTWNKWASEALDASDKNELLELKDASGQPRYLIDELKSFSSAKRHKIEKKWLRKFKFLNKSSGQNKFPDPNDTISFSNTRFNRNLNMTDFIVPHEVTFEGSEPPRVCRRLDYFSYAAMACSSSMA